MDSSRVSLGVLVVLTLAVTAAFLVMIRPFLMALLLAAIAASMLHPRFEGLAARLGGRRRLAAFAMVLFQIITCLRLGNVCRYAQITLAATRPAPTTSRVSLFDRAR